jgi:hypothetical protein
MGGPVRLVTLYTTDKKTVRAYGDYVPLLVYEPPLRSFNSPDIFIEKDVNVHHAKVHRFCKGTASGYIEKFVAFDPVLQDIVDTLVFNAAQESTAIANKISKGQTDKLKDEIKQLQSRTIWSMIVKKFTGTWSKG